MRRTFLVSVAFLLSASASFASGLIVPKASSHQIVIPAAASAEGANGTYFRSDIRITNHRDVAQRVYLQWVPQNGGPIPAVVTYIDIEPNATYASDDFVREVMNFEGLGAIVARAVDANGVDDPNGRLHATTRVWTPQPFTDGLGTTAQSFPSIPLNEIVSERVVIIGHRRNDRYRTNLGILNLDSTGAHRFRVFVSGENPTLVPEIHHVDVPALALVQVPLPGVPQNQLRIDIEEEVAAGQGHLTLWTAYASSVDNTTGDAWSTLGFNLPVHD